MLKFLNTAACAALVAGMFATIGPASAQFGNLFGEGPPRPPGSVPRGAPPPPQFEDDEEVPELPQGRVLPSPSRPLPPGQGVPRPGQFQSQPLAPPPGVPTAPSPSQAAPAQPPAAGAPPAQAARPVAPPVDSVPPAPPTLQPGDEVVVEMPAQKIVNKKAVFAGLDKITGRITKFDVDLGETVQFGALRLKTDACYTRPATEAANTDAFVEVDEITLQGEVKRIFSGWMFAASPGLHGVEHPIYDVWLTDCKSPEAAVATTQPEPPRPATPAANRRQQQRNSAPAQPRQPQPPALPSYRQ